MEESAVVRKYLIISNISKRNNAYSLIQTAHAFGFTPIAVGMAKIFPENRKYGDTGREPEARAQGTISLSLSSDGRVGDGITEDLKVERSGVDDDEGDDDDEEETTAEKARLEYDSSAKLTALAEVGTTTTPIIALEAVTATVFRPTYLSDLTKTVVFKRNLDDAREYLKQRDIPIISIEIAESAKSVVNFPFAKSVAFMPGNEGTGLNAKQREISDGFIYIPQYGQGIESLNVTVATSVILHQYCVWDGMKK